MVSFLYYNHKSRRPVGTTIQTLKMPRLVLARHAHNILGACLYNWFLEVSILHGAWPPNRPYITYNNSPNTPRCTIYNIVPIYDSYPHLYRIFITALI